MICPYCGKENPENIEICEFCGGPLTGPIEEAAAEPYNPEPKVTIIQSPPPEVKIPHVEPASSIPYVEQVSSVPPEQRGTSRNRIWWLVGCFVLVFLFLCCAVGLLVVYRSINGISRFLPDPPAVTSTPVSSQNVLLYDDFSDPNSGWDRVDETDFYSDYFDGAYRIIVYSDMYDSWANPDNNIYTDVSIEVDASKNAGPDDNDFGVICRYQGANQFYYAVISSDGYYGIFKVTSNTTTQLGAEEMQPSDNINQGVTANHIRFDCIGDKLTLYANGLKVDQENDNEYTSGNVGLIAGTYDTPGTDILFDNFSVIQP